MSKKKRDKKIFEDLEIVSAEAHAESTEAAKADAEHDAPVPDANLENAAETSVPQELPSSVEPSGDPNDSVSPDDILDDVRRSLIEDEAHAHEEQPKWWRRIGRGSRKSTATDTEKTSAVEEVELPGLDAMAFEPQHEKQAEPEDEYQDQIDELIDLLDTDEAVTESPVPVVDDTPAEPEKVIDIEELKKQAFQHRPSEDNAQNLSEVRAIALEDGDEVFVEVQSTTQDPLEERIKAVENAFKPYRRYINFAFAFLGLVMAVIAAALLFNVYKQSLPEPTPEELSNLPFPTAVSLPGGWSFNLGRGSLVDGNWNPKGAEWLEGTEVCRWVALPWSRQLEAVIRTLNADDPIGLGMSNSDQLTYKVDSIEQLSPEEMQKLDSNSPCLLIVLAEPGAEKRWVLTALP